MDVDRSAVILACLNHYAPPEKLREWLLEAITGCGDLREERDFFDEERNKAALAECERASELEAAELLSAQLRARAEKAEKERDTWSANHGKVAGSLLDMREERDEARDAANMNCNDKHVAIERAEALEEEVEKLSAQLKLVGEGVVDQVVKDCADKERLRLIDELEKGEAEVKRLKEENAALWESAAQLQAKRFGIERKPRD